MDVKTISAYSELNASDIEMVKATLGEESFKRISDALDNIVAYTQRARARGVDEGLLKYNVTYHFIRLYCAITAKNDGDRENVGRVLIKQIVADEPTRSQLYVHLFDEGGVHEKLTLIKRPA